MRVLSLDLFEREPRVPRTVILLNQGSGSFAVPGVILGKLWAERPNQFQYIDHQAMYDRGTEKHYICLRYVANDGFLCDVISDSVKIEEFIEDPFVKYAMECVECKRRKDMAAAVCVQHINL